MDLVTPLMVRSPVRTPSLSPVTLASVATKVISGYFSTSKKSPVRTWPSRSALPVSMDVAWMTTLAALLTFSGSMVKEPV